MFVLGFACGAFAMFALGCVTFWLLTRHPNDGTAPCPSCDDGSMLPKSNGFWSCQTCGHWEKRDAAGRLSMSAR